MPNVVADLDILIAQASVAAAVKDAQAAGEKIGRAIGNAPAVKRAASQLADAIGQELGGGRVPKYVDRLLSALGARLKTGSAEIKRAFASGLLTPDEGRAQGAALAREFNAGLLAGIGRIESIGGFKGTAGRDLFVGLTDQLIKVETVAPRVVAATDRVAAAKSTASSGAVKWAAGMGNLTTTTTSATKALDGKAAALNKVRGGLVALAVQSTNTSGAVGQLVSGLLLFGAGSAVVLGVAAGIGLIAKAYDLLTTKSREAQAATKTFFDDLKREVQAQRERDDPITKARESFARISAEAERVGRELRVALQGGEQIDTAEGPVLTGLRSAAQIAELRQQLKEFGDDAVFVGRKLDEALAAKPDSPAQGRIQAEVARLGTLLSLGKAANADRERATQLVREFGAELARTTGADLESQKRRVELAQNIATLTAAGTRATKEAGREAKASAEDAAQLAAKQEALLSQLQGVLAGTTTSLTDNLKKQLRDLIASFGEVSATAPPALVAAFNEAVTTISAQIDSATFAEDFARQFADIQQSITDGLDSASLQNIIGQLDALQSAAKIALVTLADGTEEQKAAQEFINSLIEKRNALQARANELLTTENLRVYRTATSASDVAKAAAARIAALEQQRDRLADQARTIEEAARGALQLADAFGLVDGATAKILEDIVQVAANIPEIINQIKLVQAGGKISGLVAAALPVIGGVASLAGSVFGKSPEEKALEQALDRNVEALRDLTKGLIELGRITGNQLKGVQAFTAGLLADRTFGRGGSSGVGGSGNVYERRAIGQALEDSGLSLKDLEAAAKSVGIELVLTREGIEQLDQALKNAQFEKFAKTTEGQLAQMRYEFDLFDITDPIEQVKAYTKVLQEQSGHVKVLEELTKGLDLTTEAGQRELLARTRKFYEDLKAGRIKLEDLGGLDIEAVRQYLLTSSNLVTDSLTSFGQDVRNAAEAAAQQIDAAFNAANSRIDQRAAVFGLGGEDTFRLKFDQFKSRSAAAARDFAGLDIGTDAGAKAIQAKIRKLFTEGSFGNLPVNPDDDIQSNAPPGPGQLSQEEFLRGLVELQGSIDAIVAGREQKRVDDQNTRDRAREDASRSADERQRAREKAAQDRQRAAEDKLREAEARARARREAEEGRIRALDETRGGLLTHLQEAIDVLHVDDAVTQLQELAKVFRDPAFAAPALKAALAGLDVTTPEGRVRAEAALQNLFRTIQARNFTGVDDRVTVDAIRRLQDGLLRANEQATPAGTDSGFTVSREVTTTQANVLENFFRSSVFFQSQQTDYLRGILANTALLAGLRSAGSDALRPRGDVAISIAPNAVQVTISGADLGNDPRAFGAEIGDALMSRIDVALNRRFVNSAMMGGNAGLPR